MKTTWALTGIILTATVILFLGGPRSAQALEPFHTHPKHSRFKGAQCAACHATHGPVASKLLKENEVKICRTCHNYADTTRWKVDDQFGKDGKGRSEDRFGWNPPYNKENPGHDFVDKPFHPTPPSQGGKGQSSPPPGKGKKK